MNSLIKQASWLRLMMERPSKVKKENLVFLVGTRFEVKRLNEFSSKTSFLVETNHGEAQ